jgi:hypothetical protein
VHASPPASALNASVNLAVRSGRVLTDETAVILTRVVRAASAEPR